jgi:hypothetical protein
MKRAREMVGGFLKDVDLASLVREQHPSTAAFHQAVGEQVSAARRLAAPANAWQHVLLVVPDDPPAAELREDALEALANVPVTVVEAGDALQVCWEGAGLSWPRLASRFTGDDPAFIELAEKLETRRDVSWTPMDSSAE